jgi:two-component system sensor histidine kinase KdpD
LEIFHTGGGWNALGRTTAAVAGLTVVLWFVHPGFVSINVALLYLLPVLWAAVRWGLWPSLYAAITGVLCFDFFFIPPIFSLTVNDLRFLVSFSVFLVVAILTGSLASSLKRQVQETQEREAITASLYSLSKRISAVHDVQDVVDAVVQHLYDHFNATALILLPDAPQHFQAPTPEAAGMEPFNIDVLEWVYQHGTAVGFGQRHRPALLYLPLMTEKTVHGVFCIGHDGAGEPLVSGQQQSFEALASLAAVSIARVQYEAQAHLAQLSAESERIRTALLDSLSHELRTPLTTMMGAASALTESHDKIAWDDQKALLNTIQSELMRLNRLISNLLGMVRIEGGLLSLNTHPSDIADIIGVTLHQLHDTLLDHRVTVELPENVGPIEIDEVLMEQALVNILSNAAKYSPKGEPIEITVSSWPDFLRVEIKDRGIGIDPREAPHLFEKFYRSAKTQHIPGTGLGLAICQAIAAAHGGEVYAAPNGPKGTAVTLEIPWNPLKTPCDKGE